jgi:anaerobic selenocysteine-containing dehydrogenase
MEGFAELKKALVSGDEEQDLALSGVEAVMFDKAYALLRDEVNIGVIFASGITGSEESLLALLDLCLLKGLNKRGLIMPAALQSNALGMVSLVEELVAPDELLLDADISGLFIYEEDPFHYLNEEMVKNALKKKEFIAVCDLLPTSVMDFAHVVLPSATFAEKEGSFLSGDGRLRTVRRACGSAQAGFDFLRELLNLLGGKRYDSPKEIKSDLEQGGLLRDNGGDEEVPAIAAGRARFAVKPSTGSFVHGETGKYRLILRDLFMNHHIADIDVYGKGIARVQKDLLCISPEDAAALNIADGDEVCLESDSGSVTRPVVIKAGIKRGVLEALLFRKRREMLALSPRPVKVMDVSLRKA